MKKWVIKNLPPDRHRIFVEEWGISPVKAALLYFRKVRDLEDLRRFLYPSLDNLLPPSIFPDMEKASWRLRKAQEKGERVLLFGDYDVDGITSLAILRKTLDILGIQSQFYIPSRLDEGYGLNSNVLELVKKQGIDLIICVDTGTQDFEVLEKIKKMNVDTIIIDHHLICKKRGYPESFAFINPYRDDYPRHFRSLSAASLSFKFAWQVLGRLPLEFMDLVCLSVVCDVMPFLDENRIFLKEGLKFLKATSRKGLIALARKAGVSLDRLDIFHIGYILGPRLNSSGRLESALKSLRLILTDSLEEAEEISSQLEELNRKRKDFQDRVYQEARFLIDKEVDFKEDKVLVLGKEDWHVGVLGIVASRISQELNRPTILLSADREVYRGSGRSIKGFDIAEALSMCEDYLLEFGGHSGACGLSLLKNNIQAFKKKINEISSQYFKEEVFLPSSEAEARISLEEIDEDFCNFLRLLRPFGEGNPKPLFVAEDVFLKAERGNIYALNGKRVFFLKGKILEAAKSAHADILFSVWPDSPQGDVVLDVEDLRFKDRL